MEFKRYLFGVVKLEKDYPAALKDPKLDQELGKRKGDGRIEVEGATVELAT